MTGKLLRYAMFILLLGSSGCAGTGADVCGVENNVENKVSALESYNQAMFSFNTKVEKYVMRPIARGYRKVTNDYVRQRITNFFNNISEPVSAVNHLLQGELADSGKNVGRFVVNTTVGLVGLYDVADDIGLERKSTGFDETLATWCVPDGPYVVLPVIGPSTPRAMTGLFADGYASPMYWAAQESNGEDAWIAYFALGSLKYLNLYAENLKMLESLEEGAIDYYETVKSAYMQNRSKLKKCGRQEEMAVPEYDFDMGDMDDMDEEIY